MSCVDPYKLLGVTIKHKREDIRSSFKSLSLLCHPDKGGRREDMEVLYIAYRYILEQIEFAEHGRTMEDEEAKFKEFLELQNSKKSEIPSFYEIMTDEKNKDFNEIFEKRLESEDEYGICYQSNYEEKIKLEPEVFTREIIEYKEPKTYQEMNFKPVYDFTMHPVQDFSGGGCVDYIVAFSPPEEMKSVEEKNVEEEFERLIKLRTQIWGESYCTPYPDWGNSVSQ
jgi:curved DNA-binding protein CbpA